MKINVVTQGTLHVIMSEDGQTLRFESEQRAEPLQLLALIEQIGNGSGYDVSRFANAKLTLVVEADDTPEYQQTL